MNMFKKATLPAAIGLIALSGAVTTQAQEAQTLAPEFYGMLYVSLDLQKSENTIDATQDEPSHWALNSRNSRIGVKQDIALNDKLTAVYKIETGVEIDDGDRNGKSFRSEEHTSELQSRPH